VRGLLNKRPADRGEGGAIDRVAEVTLELLAAAEKNVKDVM